MSHRDADHAAFPRDCHRVSDRGDVFFSDHVKRVWIQHAPVCRNANEWLGLHKLRFPEQQGIAISITSHRAAPYFITQFVIWPVMQIA